MILEARHANYYRNRKIPRDELAYDTVLSPLIRRAEKKTDRFDDKIIKKILEEEEQFLS
jgi:hypothetical protein